MSLGMILSCHDSVRAGCCDLQAGNASVTAAGRVRLSSARRRIFQIVARRAELLYPKLLFSCADFPGTTGQIARAEQGGRSCFAKRMECVELAPAVRCVARFESGSKLHALHTLRAVRLRLCRAED